jgi:caa(3)-type oxidase subunit IV
MTAAPHSENHAGPSFQAYLVVFGALSVFTAFSFVFNELVRHGTINSTTGLLLILGVAVCKAVLVAMYFMHLVLDWGKLYYLIFPVLILGTMLVIVLLPDIVLAWSHKGPLFMPPVGSGAGPRMIGN